MKSNYKLAFQSFIKLVDSDSKEIINNNYYTIIELYNQANYNNLRHLRYSIIDFNLFLKFIPDVYYKNENLIIHIIKCFFAISFELRKGNITSKNIIYLTTVGSANLTGPPITDNLTDPPITTDPPIPNDLYSIKRKYDVFKNHTSQPVSSKQLQLFFESGRMDVDEVKESILESIYYKEIPNWKKFWAYSELEDEDFEDIYNKVFGDFKNLRINNKYEIIQITGILLRLIKDKIVEKPYDEIIQLGEENINKIVAENTFSISPFENYPSQSSHGFSYQSLDENTFQDFLIFAKNVWKSEYKKLAISKEEIFKILDESIEKFKSLLILVEDSENSYFDRPILTKIPAKDFYEKYFNLSNKDKKTMQSILSKRYSFGEHNLLLLDELDWLIELKNYSIDEEFEAKSISNYIYKKGLLPTLDNIISKLTDLQNNLQEKILPYLE